MSDHAAILAKLYRQSDDPWGYRTRWYELRKREILLASLPRPNFEHVLELGCSNGELAAALAERASTLIATEENADAVSAARAQLSSCAQVTLLRQCHPKEWPAGQFDLIVFSELGYYFSKPDLIEVARRIKSSLQPDGSVVACHWRWPIQHCDLTGDDVHVILDRELGLPLLASHHEKDFRLDLWLKAAESIAQREGLA